MHLKRFCNQQGFKMILNCPIPQPDSHSKLEIGFDILIVGTPDSWNLSLKCYVYTCVIMMCLILAFDAFDAFGQGFEAEVCKRFEP